MAARAGVDLSAPACWLLARLGEDGWLHLPALAARSRIDLEVLQEIRVELAGRGLAGARPGAGSTREALERLTQSCEAHLGERLDGWRADEHAELVRLVAMLSRELLLDSSTPRVRVRAGAGGGTGGG
ncbi:MAG: hypothetical protein E6G62_07515 [Actinobacteria bacterium]|nr:MAG: hypothetical protein E6G62_07515 [Actinomycetota bacterium]